MKIALCGATGRMGAAFADAAMRAGDQIAGALAAPSCDSIGADLGDILKRGPMGVLVQDNVAAAIAGADVVVDFSHASVFSRVLQAAANARVPVVSGTTAIGDKGQAALQLAAQRIPVIWASNFSIGIHVLGELLQHALRLLGPGFDVEMFEVHHRGKADAPSGTALKLAEKAREVRPELEQLSGRSGMVGARKSNELGVMALRGGDVAGDHHVFLLGQGERIELVHRAGSRDVLAQGALHAARWIIKKPPGRYELGDTLDTV